MRVLCVYLISGLFLLYWPIAVFAQMPDMEKICNSPGASANPQLAQFCGGMGGTGGGSATPAGGGESLADLQKKVQAAKAANPAAAKAAGPAPAKVNSGGNVGQSHINSIGTNFRAFDADAMRKKMKKKKRKPPPKKKVKKKPKPKPKPKPEPEPEPEKEPVVAEKVEPEPEPLPPPKKATANRVVEDFNIAKALFKNVDLHEPFDGTRSLSDLPLAAFEPKQPLILGISNDLTPRLFFSIYPVTGDPFNLGLPRKPPARKKPSLVGRLLDKVLGKVNPGAGASGEIGYYLAFDEPPADTDYLAGVPQAVFWSGPVTLLPAIGQVSAGASVPLPAAPILGEDPEDPLFGDALWDWGLISQ